MSSGIHHPQWTATKAEMERHRSTPAVHLRAPQPVMPIRGVIAVMRRIPGWDDRMSPDHFGLSVALGGLRVHRLLTTEDRDEISRQRSELVEQYTEATDDATRQAIAAKIQPLATTLTTDIGDGWTYYGRLDLERGKIWRPGERP